jgi:hypothetical protein
MSTPGDHREPALPAALPALDLSRRAEARTVTRVEVSTSALQAGLRTATCPQCGLNPATTLVKRRFIYVPPWVYIGLALNIIVLAIMYVAGRRVVDAQLSLCADCDAADRRARSLTSVSLFGLIGFPTIFGIAGGALVGLDAGMFGLAVGLVAGVVGVVAAHRHTKQDAIRCTFVDKARGVTTLAASDTLQRVLAQEAPTALR